MAKWTIFAAVGAATMLVGSAQAQSDTDRSFNRYVLKAVEYIAQHRAGGGYDLNRAFTQNLGYGGDVVKASAASTGSGAAPPYPTMCVAAVAEVMIEALRIYAEETGDKSAFQQLGARSWNSGNLRSIKANLFMFAETGSRGTAGTLQRFGMGKEVPFAELRPGDFVNLNRQKSGHAVVFMGYLDRNYNILPGFGPNVAGFKYFSAQGKGKPDAGFAYRYAYFGPYCPAPVAGKPRDCGVIRSANQKLLNTGTMYHPKHWRVAEAAASMQLLVRSAVKSKNPTRSVADVDMLTNIELDRELAPNPGLNLDGETTD